MGLLWGQEQFVGIIFFLDCIFLDRIKKKNFDLFFFSTIHVSLRDVSCVCWEGMKKWLIYF
jgi:hypothetical protein